MIDFLDLFNMVARVARPAHHEFVPIESLDVRFADTCLDSLDMLMIGMYFSMIYDVEDEIAKTFQPETMQELIAFIEEHKKRDPESIEWARELIK